MLSQLSYTPIFCASLRAFLPLALGDIDYYISLSPPCQHLFSNFLSEIVYSFSSPRKPHHYTLFPIPAPAGSHHAARKSSTTSRKCSGHSRPRLHRRARSSTGSALPAQIPEHPQLFAVPYHQSIASASLFQLVTDHHVFQTHSAPFYEFNTLLRILNHPFQKRNELQFMVRPASTDSAKTSFGSTFFPSKKRRAHSPPLFAGTLKSYSAR